MTAAVWDLPPIERGTPFVPDTIDFYAEDFTGAAFKMQLRFQKDSTGPAPISLENAAAGNEGISCTVTWSEGVPTSHVQLQIDEETIEALPFAAEPGGDVPMFYDMHVTKVADAKRRRLRGRAIVSAGVTL
ncbi:hypothetical protein [Sphingomonas hengshuiensis]|uniref:Uncharacterized protein n=1 Tax=Sphingomonas hengshuiensis TaxID=1609977 RepID=A0A7U4LFX8_9SPHN|nr:hypothetical protein [Sphingomonas hengshuiensis]AJP72920.1 hypothetical protein TS85_15670 [Sphingomonas hengshuiensis]